MPIRGAKNIRDLIYYQYAKVIARRGFSVSDGKEVKNQHYGFGKETFRDLNQEWNTDGTEADEIQVYWRSKDFVLSPLRGLGKYRDNLFRGLADPAKNWRPAGANIELNF